MVSFIVPVYNGEKYIERNLKSIINNTNGDYEIIVIDDGSTDRSLEVIKRIKKQFCVIKIISQNNSGVSSAREAGIKAALGEWIVFVDADDYIISDITELIKEKRCEQCDWIIFSKQFRKSNAFTLNEENCKKTIITAILNQNQKNEIGSCKLNTVWSKAYKKDIINKYNIHFEKGLTHGEDMIFNLDYSKNCRWIYFCTESVYMLCGNENSTTHRFQKNCVKNDKIFFDLLNKREIFTQNSSLRKCYYRIVLNGIWICLNQYFAHKDNISRLNDKQKELTLMLKQEPYRTALKNYSVENNIGKKIVFALLDLHFYKFVLKMLEILRKSFKKNAAGLTEI